VAICSSLAEEALESWEYARNGVIEEVENLSEGDVDFRPTAESRSTREIVRHILESALRWEAGDPPRMAQPRDAPSWPLALHARLIGRVPALTGRTR
jgi:hypothetical protein